MLYGRAPFTRPIPFLEPGFHPEQRAPKYKPKTQRCFFRQSGNNHPRECCKVLIVFDRRSYTRDVTCEHPREAFAKFLSAAWGRDTPSPAPRLSEAQIPPEDWEVWYELKPVPSRASPGPPPVPSKTSTSPAHPSHVQSTTSPRTSQPPLVPSSVPSRV